MIISRINVISVVTYRNLLTTSHLIQMVMQPMLSLRDISQDAVVKFCRSWANRGGSCALFCHACVACKARLQQTTSASTQAFCCLSGHGLFVSEDIIRKCSCSLGVSPDIVSGLLDKKSENLRSTLLEAPL